MVELCFEGVQLLKIVPPKENYSTEILSATLYVDEEGVFGADNYMEKPNITYDGSDFSFLMLTYKSELAKLL